MKGLLSSSKALRLLAIAILLIVIAVMLTLKLTAPSSDSAKAATQNSSTEHSSQSQNTADTHTKTVTVHSGQSLSGIFQSLSIQNVVLQQIMQLPLAKKYLHLILPGQKLNFIFDQTELLQQLSFSISDQQNLQITFSNNRWHAKIIQLPVTFKLKSAEGTIKLDLNLTAKHIGLPKTITAQIANIFSDKINFLKDIRPGDHFKVLYQQEYVNGKFTKNGHVVIAEFFTKKQHYTAIYYKDPKGHSGYYAPDGKNMKLGLMRYPLKFKRISSPFTYRRLDPILHVYRPHLGVDLAADRGTPLHAVGNGEIIFMGKKGGYGNAIIVRYGPHITILCGHLEKFAKHLHKYSKVKMGQVIGYVGSTGWSTGPHVHYEIHLNGVPVNPVTLKLPDGKPVAWRYRKAFKQHAQELINQLNAG